MNKLKLKKGISLVEVLVAVSVFVLILGTLIAASNFYLVGASSNLRLVKATYLAEEGMEAVKTMRDASWQNISNLALDTDNYLYFDTVSSTWKATSTTNTIDSYTRKFIISSVKRDGNGKISDTGTLDEKNRKED